MPESVVVDASAMVETLTGTRLGRATRTRLRGCELHAPAHFDAEVLSALGRLHRAGELDATLVSSALSELAIAPIVRHALAGLLAGAWAARDRLRLVDALYVELSTALGAALVTTDARLARSTTAADLVD
ncbi:MAG TPA: type II toxin-antitoxin system VapC family toxin [Solirubrobacteraceae bacterium]|nr:type II toxin-antitoxin system VapC family toxin [Solirubrobacteraceae bacterium]